MIARALVGTGLHPALGLHHHNQYNGLCLADDLMEPFRPWVDYLVYSLTAKEPVEVVVDKHTKKPFLQMLNEKVLWQENQMPLLVSSHHLAAHLKRSYTDKNPSLDFPLLHTRVV
jgi:CRISPR-associated protein Cas1